MWHGWYFFITFWWHKKIFIIIYILCRVKLIFSAFDNLSNSLSCSWNILETALFTTSFFNSSCSIYCLPQFLYFFETVLKVLIFCVTRNFIKPFISNIEFVKINFFIYSVVFYWGHELFKFLILLIFKFLIFNSSDCSKFSFSKIIWCCSLKYSFVRYFREENVLHLVL